MQPNVMQATPKGRQADGDVGCYPYPSPGGVGGGFGLLQRLVLNERFCRGFVFLGRLGLGLSSTLWVVWYR